MESKRCGKLTSFSVLSIPGTTRFSGGGKKRKKEKKKGKQVVGLERSPLSLVSTTEELLDRKVAAPV
jgi:hypothetical protein